MSTGQLIFEIQGQPLSSDLKQRSDGLLLLAKILVFALLVLTSFGVGSQLWDVSLTATDILIYTLVITAILFLFLVLQSILRRQVLHSDPANFPEISIFEYGIKISSHFCPREKDGCFITYNEILGIEVNRSPPSVDLVGDTDRYHLDLRLLIDSRRSDQPELLSKFLAIIFKIKQNLRTVENRNFPTIIPRAYFRDILYS